MKIFKYTMMALALAGFMTACSDDNDYQPGTLESGAGAYFPTTDATSYTVADDGSTFDVKVARGSDAAAATFNVTSTANAEIFSVPTSISFAAGQKDAVLTISYNPETFGYDNKQTFSVTIQEAGNYGNATLNLSVVIPAPWVSIGKATYTDDCIMPLFDYPPVSYPVEMQRNEKNPNLLRLVNPYGKPFPYYSAEDDEAYGPDNRYMEIDITDPDNVTIPGFNTGLDWGYGYMSIYSYNAYTGENDPSKAGVYDEASGSIIFPVKSMITYLPSDGVYYGSLNGKTSIYFPGFLPRDYSAIIQYAGLSIDVEGVAVANAVATLGADVAFAKAAVVETRSLTVAANLIDSGDVECVTLNAGSYQNVSFEISENGSYMVAVVAYDAEGNVQNYAGDTFTVTSISAAEQWSTIGVAGMYDGWLIPALFGTAPYQYGYYVLIQQNDTNPGLYRLKNPYGENSPIGSYNDDPVGADIVIDATDPEFVLMYPQYSGFTLSNGAELYISDLASYYYNKGVDKAEIAAEGLANTINQDGRIEFVVPLYSVGSNWYASYEDVELEEGEEVEYVPGYIILPEPEDEETPEAQASRAAQTKKFEAAKAHQMLSAPVKALDLSRACVQLKLIKNKIYAEKAF